LLSQVLSRRDSETIDGGENSAKYLILLVGAQGLEPWTR